MFEIFIIISLIVVWFIFSKEFKEKNIRNEERKTLLFEVTEIKDFNLFFSDHKHLIRFLNGSSIPPGKIYYKYIGGGGFIRKIKYNQSNSPLPKISVEAEQRVLDYANGCGKFSPTYKPENITRMVFNQNTEN